MKTIALHKPDCDLIERERDRLADENQRLRDEVADLRRRLEHARASAALAGPNR